MCPAIDQARRRFVATARRITGSPLTRRACRSQAGPKRRSASFLGTSSRGGRSKRLAFAGAPLAPAVRQAPTEQRQRAESHEQETRSWDVGR